MRFPIRFLIILMVLFCVGPAFAGWSVSFPDCSGFGDGMARAVDNGIVAGNVERVYDGSYTKHAALWDCSNNTRTDLNPEGYAESIVYDISGEYQVGAAADVLYGSRHAGIWHGTASSWVDLGPPEGGFSEALAVSGSSVVGFTWGGDYRHASLWAGDAHTWVDLHPEGLESSSALDVEGDVQVGYASGTITPNHASLWRGSADSWVDLNPEGFEISTAYAVSGSKQAGSGYPGYAVDEHGWGHEHALMWSGTADSWIDLNPVGYLDSCALDIDGDVQVGWVSEYAQDHACMWMGSADNYVDLEQFLAYTPCYGSRATGVEVSPDGKIIVAGYARSWAASLYVPVVWTYTPDPVPEPSSLLALGSGLLGLMGVVRRRRYGIADLRFQIAD